MREANALHWHWEGKVAMHTESCKMEVQRKEEEEREEKETQRKAAAVKVAKEHMAKAIEECAVKAIEECVAKARQAERESVKRSKGATKASKEQAEGAKKLTGSPNEALSGAFSIGMLMKSLHEPPTKAGRSSNVQDSGMKTTASSVWPMLPSGRYEGWSRRGCSQLLNL